MPPVLFRRHSFVTDPRAPLPRLAPKARLRSLSNAAVAESHAFEKLSSPTKRPDEWRSDGKWRLQDAFAPMEDAFHRLQPQTASRPPIMPMAFDARTQFLRAIETVSVERQLTEAEDKDASIDQLRELTWTLAAHHFRNAAPRKGIEWLELSKEMLPARADRRMASREIALAPGPSSRAGWVMVLFALEHGEEPMSSARYESALVKIFGYELLWSLLACDFDINGQARTVASERRRIGVQRGYQTLSMVHDLLHAELTRQEGPVINDEEGWTLWFAGLAALSWQLPPGYGDRDRVLPEAHVWGDTTGEDPSFFPWATSYADLHSMDDALDWFGKHQAYFPKWQDQLIRRPVRPLL